MVATGKRNLQLDFLRGIAILLVIGRHLELPRPDGVVGLFANVWFKIGWLGVDLFFVLSGFLIGGLLLSELARHGRINVSRFLWRRGLKIYPPYFVFLAYLMLLPVAKGIARGEDGWGTFVENWMQYWPNLLFLQNYIGTNPAGHTWTLAVEEHFYLFLPFALAALVSTGRIRFLVPLAVAAVPICLGLRCLSVYTNDLFAAKLSATHLRLDALLFGVAIRGIAQYHPERFLNLRRWRGALFLTGIALWVPIVFVAPTNNWIRTVGLTATFLGSAAFLIATYHTHENDFGRLGKWVSPAAKLIAWVGVYSYGIYLWHVSLIGILERIVGRRLLALFGDRNGLAWLVSVLAITIGAVVVGVVASKIIEWPVLRFRDRFFPSRSASLPLADQNRLDPVRTEPPVSSVPVPNV
jgi:peptidoglycan/LPS O-acetylase OafA/YrhL